MSEPAPATSRGVDTAARREASWLRRWAEALVIAFLVVTFVATTVGIEGNSMTPTLLDGERTLVPRYETWAVRLGLRAWRVDDVVYFRAPGDAPRTLLERLTGGPYVIKRVVATGGQSVAFERGRLLVDGAPVHTPSGLAHPFGTITRSETLVPEGQLYVLGDDRSPLGSRDSRAFGPVPVASVAGRAAWVVWPPLRRDAAGQWHLNVRRVPRRRGGWASA